MSSRKAKENPHDIIARVKKKIHSQEQEISAEFTTLKNKIAALGRKKDAPNNYTEMLALVRQIATVAKSRAEWETVAWVSWHGDTVGDSKNKDIFEPEIHDLARQKMAEWWPVLTPEERKVYYAALHEVDKEMRRAREAADE